VTTVDSGALRAAFLAGYGFGLDDFQLRALDAVDAGASVLVAAPTSSGKTVVAEYAIARALAEARRRSTPHRSRRCRTRSTRTSRAATDPPT